MRFTIKEENSGNYYLKNPCHTNEDMNKWGKLEDLEDQLGVDLYDLIYYKITPGAFCLIKVDGESRMASLVDFKVEEDPDNRAHTRCWIKFILLSKEYRDVHTIELLSTDYGTKWVFMR